MKFLFTIITALILTLEVSIGQQANLETLKLVQLLFRHGERVPEYAYPTDPYNAKDFWKEGWGQLTEVGKKQEYSLGQYLRTRYQGFVSDDFVPEEIYLLSSDLDRTIISAELCLAGMFPTENGTTWNPDLKWQPVPLHTISTEQDNLLRCKKPCPKFNQDFQDFLYNSPNMKKINEDNKELFEYLTNNSGVNVTNIDKIDSFYATLMVEEMLGLEIPEWAKSVVNTPNFQYLYNISFEVKTSTPDFKRLRAGPLVKYFMDNINTRVSNTSMKTKMYMLSGHDTTMVNILNTLDVMDTHRPFYSTVFMLELHEDPQTGEFFVQIHYRNDTGREPYQLAIPGCNFNCPLTTFLKYTEPIIPLDWENECLIELPDDSGTSVSYIVAVVATSILLLLLAYYLLSVACRKRNKRGTTRGDYQQF